MPAKGVYILEIPNQPCNKLLGQSQTHMIECHTYFKAVRKSTDFIIIFITDDVVQKSSGVAICG